MFRENCLKNVDKSKIDILKKMKLSCKTDENFFPQFKPEANNCRTLIK